MLVALQIIARFAGPNPLANQFSCHVVRMLIAQMTVSLSDENSPISVPLPRGERLEINTELNGSRAEAATQCPRGEVLKFEALAG